MKLIFLIALMILATSSVVLASTAYIYSFKNENESIAKLITEEFKTRGYDISIIDTNSFGSIANTREQGNVLVLVDSQYFPIEYTETFVNFLKAGNHFVGISEYPFTNPIQRVGSQFVEAKSIGSFLEKAPQKEFITFKTADLEKIIRTSSSGNIKNTIGIESVNGSGTFTIKTDAVDNWEGFYLAMDNIISIPENSSYITFSAKGNDTSPELWIGFQESDGSRWLNKIKLEKDFKKYYLSSKDFAYWNDSYDGGKRGKSGDKLNLSNINRLEFALMAAPGGNPALLTIIGEPQDVAISDIKIIDAIIPESNLSLPDFRSLYPLNNMHFTKINNTEIIDGEIISTTDTIITSPMWRNKGLGVNYTGNYRQIPLAYGYDNKDLRGIVSEILLNYPGSDWGTSAWGYIGYKMNFLKENPQIAQKLFSQMADSLKRGVFLASGGVDAFSYLPNERIALGYSLLTLNEDNHDNTNIEVVMTDVNGKEIFKETYKTKTPIDEIGESFGKERLNVGEYFITTNLIEDGKIVDSLKQGFTIFNPNARTKENSVTQKNGNFYVNGEIWVPYGVNYWPLYASGRLPEEYFSDTWLSPEQYDPILIERDLDILDNLKMNCISIQFTQRNEPKQMRDLIERCKKHNIKVHLYTAGSHPLLIDFDFLEEILSKSNVGDSEAIFCYDLGWEVNAGDHKQRTAFDQAWNNWVINQYGSFDNAIKDWKFEPEKENGLYSNPTDEMLKTPKPDHLIYISAYRRFMDDHISKNYQIVIDRVRKYDKLSLMSARSGYGGTGSEGVAYMLPFDLKSGVRHLDYTAPEAYNIGGGRKGFLRGDLNNIYGRFVSKNKPVVWPEYGNALFYGVSRENYVPGLHYENFSQQAAYYQGMADFMAETKANGGLGWWFVGGYRVDERSDFGIINPDGTPRPSAIVIRDTFDKVTKGYTPIDKFDTFIEIDRDKYGMGYAGLFTDFSEKVAELSAQGKKVGIKTQGTGTNSANTPKIAVGNTPFVNGKNPIKYLNAEFNWIEINGNKIIKSGETIEIKKNYAIIVNLSVANTEESMWLAKPDSKKIGDVGVVIKSFDKESFYGIPKNVSYLEDVSMTDIYVQGEPESITLRMRSTGVADFGEIIKVNIKYTE